MPHWTELCVGGPKHGQFMACERYEFEVIKPTKPLKFHKGFEPEEEIPTTRGLYRLERLLVGEGEDEEVVRIWRWKGWR